MIRINGLKIRPDRASSVMSGTQMRAWANADEQRAGIIRQLRGEDW